MATPAAVLSILVQANGTAATSGALHGVQRDLEATNQHVNRLGVSWENAGKRMAGVGQNMTRLGQQWNRTVTLPIVGGMGLAIRSAMNFQGALTQVETQAGASSREINRMRGELLKLAPAVGQTPTALANALFHIESAGIRGANALATLRDSARLAAIGHSDLEKTTNAVVAVMRSAPKDIKNTTAAIGTMNAIVGAGNMRMEALASALSTGIIPAAKGVGLGLKDVGAALDVMTSRGVPAEEAATRLRMTFSLMAAPTSKAIAALKTIGISQDQLANDMRKPGGLVVAIQDLRDHLQHAGLTAVQQNQVISHAFGGGRSSSAIMTLVQNAGDLRKAFDRVGAHSGAPEVNKAWAKTQSDLSFKWDQMKAEAQAAAIRIGDAIGPAILNLGRTVLHDATMIATAFSNLPSGLQHAILTGGLVVAGIGPALRVAGVFTTGVGRLYDAALLVSRLSFGRATGGAGGVAGGLASRAGAAVARMEVGTLVAARMAGGSVGSAFGTAGRATSTVTAAEEAGSVGLAARIASVGARALGALGVAAFAAPLVIGLGAALHKWIGNSAQRDGEQFANRFLAPLPDAVRRQFQRGLTRAGATLHDALTRRESGGVVGRPVPVSILPRSVTRANDRNVFNAYFNQGFQAGNAVVRGLHSVKDPSVPILIRDFMGRLRQLPAQARPEAAKVMLTYAESLARNGKLPRRAVDSMLATIERAFPSLGAFFNRQGLQSDRGFASALKFHTASNTLRQTLRGFRNQFGDWSISTKLTEANINDNTSRAMSHLHEIIASTTGKTRRDAERELKKLHAAVNSTFDAMVQKVSTAMPDFMKLTGQGFSRAAKAVGQNMSDFEKSVRTAMASGVLSATDGANLIGKALNAELKAFGTKQIPLATLIATEPKHMPVFVGGGHAGHFERGGLFQFGQRGAAGQDSIPLNFGGKPIVVAPGEVGTVMTRHQQAVADHFLSPIGGLQGLFQKVSRPHHMATGGIVNLDGHPGNIAGSLRNLIGTMESHFPALGVTATTDGSHVPGSYHYRGQAVDMASDAGTMLAAANWVKASGLYRSLAEGIHNPNLAVKFGRIFSGAGPFGAVWAGHANHIHLAITGALGAAAQAAAFQQITAPRVKGSGTIPTIVRAALGKAVAAANAYASAHEPSTLGGSYGMPMVSGGGPVEAQVYRFFSAAGLNKTAIAGMLGNAVQESNMNPATPGGGLWQMISTFGRGAPPLATQMRALLSQIRGQPIWGMLNAAGSPGDAATIFMDMFEKPAPATANLARRIAGANAAFAAGYQRGGIVGGHNSPGNVHGRPAHHRARHPAHHAPHVPSLQRLLGEPALPHLAGRAQGTIDYAHHAGRMIGGLRGLVSSLEHNYSSLDSFYSVSPQELTDPSSGAVNTGAVQNRLKQLDRLTGIRQQIFTTWGQIAVMTKRLIEANRGILARLRRQLAAIRTGGLRGHGLTVAQSHQTNLRSLISKYQGNLSSASGDLQSAMDDRDAAWISLVQAKTDRASVAATTGTSAATPVTDTSSGALQQLLTEANQRLAVSQAQFRVFEDTTAPFVGAFARGGFTSRAGWALVGENGPELAHLPGGTRILSNDQSGNVTTAAPEVVVNIAPGMEWLRNFIQVEIAGQTRSSSRVVSGHPLPGARRR